MTTADFKKEFPEYAHLEGDELWDMMSLKIALKRPFRHDQPGDEELITIDGPDGTTVTMSKGCKRMFESLMSGAGQPRPTFKFMVLDLSPPDPNEPPIKGLMEQMHELPEKKAIKPTVWMSHDEYQKLKAFQKEREHDFFQWMFYGIEPPWLKKRTAEELTEDRVKLAYVIVEGKMLTVGIDNLLGDAYEMEDKVPTFKRPLVKFTKPFKFVRWLRMMDV